MIYTSIEEAEVRKRKKLYEEKENGLPLRTEGDREAIIILVLPPSTEGW